MANGKRFWQLGLVLFALLSIGIPVQAWSQSDDEDDEDRQQFPGIWGSYSAAGKTIFRRDADVAFVWGQHAPLQQLPAGPFQAEWHGKLLVRSAGKYRFHAHFQGKLEVTFKGQQVVSGATNSDQPAQWVSGPESESEIEYGQHPLIVKFQSTGPQSRVHLYWSSDAFPLEPIPAAAYFMQEAHPDFELEVRGRELFAAHRCNRCHRREHDPLSPAGPDLTHVATNLQGDLIERWLAGDRQTAGHSWMPEYGFTKDESQAIAAFLRQQSTPVKIPQREFTDEPRKTSLENGRQIFMTLGCLACHKHGKTGAETPFGGGDLSNVGARRTADWLSSWLTDPEKLNADHRMPVFAWNGKSAELRDLVAFLSQPAVTPENDIAVTKPAPEPSALVAQGRQLVQAAKCHACHRFNEGAGVAEVQPSTLERGQINDANNCLQAKPDRNSGRPAFPTADAQALRAYLKSRTGPLSTEGANERGQRLLTWNNCLQCHPRDGGGGLGQHTASVMQSIPELEGQGPSLVPPRLNAVGDKLLDPYLKRAVAGTVTPRMTWLKVKMPRFVHTEGDQQALAQYFMDHDRIESPPRELVSAPLVPTDQQYEHAVAAGATLVGSQGFSCIACHQFGKFVPRNTALGTRGSDLLMINQRMRREFFLRWTRSPIRIIPDMEMPGYERPLPGVLDGQIQTQLSALWIALNDSRSTRTLDFSSLQQTLTVDPGAPARIIRDVFLIPRTPRSPPETPDHYIPRAFAVGFNTQHNVLFDLDAFAIQDWWQDDLARQRTQGKSWNWEPGGAAVIEQQTFQPRRVDLAFLRHNSDNPAELIEFGEPQIKAGRLVDYSRAESGIRIRYRLPAPAQTGFRDPVTVTEAWQPLETGLPTKSRGWSRQVTLSGLSTDPGLTAIIIRPDLNFSADYSIDLPSASTVKWQRLGGNDADGDRNLLPEYAPLGVAGDGTFSITLFYTAKSVESKSSVVVPPAEVATAESFSTVPGYTATRLPLPRSIMPTALTWTRDQVLAFASLKGHIYLAKDSDGDGLEDKLEVFEEGLAAPYGIITDPQDGSLLVSHKPELLRLTDTDSDGKADLRTVFATGWGYNDNYHDWTCGIVRDSGGNLYVGLGSDYTQPKRPLAQQRWRGKILRIDPTGQATPIASGFRYPTGLAMTPDDQLFVTDNQGEQNLFNELNHIVDGARYGVPSREDPKDEQPASQPAIQIPHPWTRSINGIFFIPRDARLAAENAAPHPFAGHGIGCEYDSRFLIRFTLQKVGDTFQGAVYPFSQDHVPPEQPNFEGTLCGGISPKGDIYIGCIHDSGWLGGLNVGSLVRLQSTGKIPLGIRELQATPQGFQLEFTAPIDREAAAVIANYSISAYTRQWQGTYATPDSNRHPVAVSSAVVSVDGRRVELHTDKLRTGYVYEVTCGKVGTDREQVLWPATGHYTVNRVPVEQ